VVEAAFGNAHYKWARERQSDGKFLDYSFEAMLKDIQKAEGTRATKDFMYDVSYFMHSAHAHATADGTSVDTQKRQLIDTAKPAIN